MFIREAKFNREDNKMRINYIEMQDMFDRAFSEYMEARAAKMLNRGTYQYVINAMEQDMESCNVDNIKGIIRVYHNETFNESVYIVYGRDITKNKHIVHDLLIFVLTGEEATIVFLDNIATDYKHVDGWPLYNLMTICRVVSRVGTCESLLWAIHMAEEFDPTYMGTICKLEGYQAFDAVYKEIGATLQDSIAKFYEDHEFNRKVKDAYYDSLELVYS